jgi:hypothetical protein
MTAVISHKPIRLLGAWPTVARKRRRALVAIRPIFKQGSRLALESSCAWPRRFVPSGRRIRQCVDLLTWLPRRRADSDRSHSLRSADDNQEARGRLY